MTDMKRIIYIIALILPFMAGCTKSNSSVTPEEFERYIFFSQGIDTKASLVESAGAMGQFGVVGFKYDNQTDWGTYKAGNPAPNVFYNDDGTSVASVETLTCSNDGSASYTPLQGWSNISKYAFFAYYPIDNENVTLVNLDGTSYTGGTPAIKYALSSSLIRESMVDVMIAPAHTDMYWHSASETNVTGNDIKFSFEHCLACLGLHIKNTGTGTITLKSASMTVSDLKHQDVIIPLDGSECTFGAAISGSKTCSMVLTDAEKTPTSSGVEISDKLIFIPQTEYAKITVTVEYTRSAEGYTTYEGTFTSDELNTLLTQNRRSLVYLNFTDSNVEVKQGSGAWVEVPEVDNTFN